MSSPGTDNEVTGDVTGTGAPTAVDRLEVLSWRCIAARLLSLVAVSEFWTGSEPG